MSNRFANGGLQTRIKSFVIQVWTLCEQLPKSRTAFIISDQLCRSSSSVGANFRASLRARSGKEYLAKLGICEEEADECCYWLELIIAYPKLESFQEEAKKLKDEADQLTAIVVSLIKKGKTKN